MRLTRRFGIVATVGVYFAVAAAVFDRLLFLVGTAGLGAWLVGAQYAFVSTLVDLKDTVGVTQEVMPRTGTTSDEFRVRLSVTGVSALPVSLTVELQPSPAVADLQTADRTWRVDPESDDFEREVTFRAAVAGRAMFEPPSIELTDQFGLFRETVRLGDRATATVDPPGPADIRVTRGEEVSLTYGDTAGPSGEAGLIYRGIREYVPTDPANRIDWQATARFGEPKVVKYEHETDRTVALVLDRRSSLGVGDPGRTAFDYCREVALGFVDVVEGAGDALALLVCEDDGVRVVGGPASGRDWYATVRTELHDIESPRTPGPEGDGSVSERVVQLRDGGVDAAVAKRLASDGTAFGRHIRPFCDAPEHSREPGTLPAAVVTALRTVGTDVRTALFTNDSRPDELRRSVQLMERSNDRAFLFLTPQSLYKPDGVFDIDAVYEEYAAFESFRRELDAPERVSAFELGPGDRLDELLSTVRVGQP